MTLRFHEIAEAERRTINPFTAEELRLLREAFRPREGQRQLEHLGWGVFVLQLR
jgi:hypothetical protein